MKFPNNIASFCIGLVLPLGFSLAPALAQGEQKLNDSIPSVQKAADSSPHARVSTKGVMKTQEALKEKGYYDGPVDGLIGPKTRAGLRRYQEEQGLNADGRLTRETAERLGVVSKSDSAEADKSVGEHFEDAGSDVKEHYGKAGKSLGHGAKEMGKEVKKGEVTEGAKELGKGAGKFGKEVGKGTGKAAKEAGKGVKDALDGDESKKDSEPKSKQ
jgi:peptidoglycan hydrolase-like protein with peptidoglycan-binding domain